VIPSHTFIVASFLVILLLSKVFTCISTHHAELSYATKINHLNSTCWNNFTKSVSLIHFITSYFSTQWGMYIDSSLYISMFIVMDNYLSSSYIAIPKVRKVKIMSSRTTVIKLYEKSKGKTIPVQATKAYMGITCTAALILILDTRWSWVVKFMPWQLYPRTKPQYPLDDII